MNKKQLISRVPSRSVRKMARKPASNGKIAFGVVFMLCLLGCLWVGKENWNNRLSNKALSLENDCRDLRAHADMLRTELLDVSEFTRIAESAHKRLGMVSPEAPPDTIWCEDNQPRQLMGAMVFFNF